MLGGVRDPAEKAVAEDASEAHGRLHGALHKVKASGPFGEVGSNEGQQDSVKTHRDAIQGLQ